MRRQTVVALNDPNVAQVIFAQELMPAVSEVRGERVEVDWGDYLHAIVEHDRMRTRVRWIRETLQNPISIYRHPRFGGREVYVKEIKESEDSEAELHVVVVSRDLDGGLKFCTSFTPDEPESYMEFVELGETLWKSIP